MHERLLSAWRIEDQAFQITFCRAFLIHFSAPNKAIRKVAWALVCPSRKASQKRWGDASRLPANREKEVVFRPSFPYGLIRQRRQSMTKMPAARILVADDEPLFLRTTAELLRKAGFTCECAADGDAALRALARGSFDLVISDLNMPG